MAYAKVKCLKVMGRIPFDPAFTKYMVQGKTVTEYGDSKGTEAVKWLWQRVEAELM